MILIITHNNSDFDAIASSYLLTKIFPDSVILRPSSIEKEVEEYLESSQLHIPFHDPTDKKFAKIIFTDCSSDQELIDKYGAKNCTVKVYDHHPTDDYGSNVSLLFRKFAAKLRNIDPEEAFLALLGIYQDTGGLTYASTKPVDLEASSFFLRFDPPLEKIPYFLNYYEIDENAVVIMSKIIQNGIRIGVPSCSILYSYYHVDFYYRGFSLLLNHLLNMENLHAIFVLFIYKNKVILTGRSLDERININEMLSHLADGGGHSLAASRSFPKKDEHIVERKIKNLISNDLFARPVSFFLKMMNAEQFSVDKADKGSMYFKTSNSLWEYLDLISKGYKPYLLSGKKLFSPKVHRSIVPEVMLKPPLPIPSNRKKNPIVLTLKKYLYRVLDKEILDFISQMSATASELGVRVFVVGGVVRELLTAYIEKGVELDLREIDLSVEGKDAILFATALQKRISGSKLHVYRDFNTATIKLFKKISGKKLGISFDFATARKEMYTSGGALPMVDFSSIEDDLGRRDFTVNSMALSLNRKDFGRIYDFFSGQSDLKEKKLRILHSKSFFDDPTRVLRMLRFKDQLGFELEKRTERLLRFSLAFGITQNIRGFRLTRELKSLFNGRDPIDGIEDLKKYDLIWEIFGIEIGDLSELNTLNTTVNWLKLIHPEIPIRKDLIIFGYFFRKNKGKGIKETFLFNRKELSIIKEIIQFRSSRFTRASKFSTFEKRLGKRSNEARLFYLSLLKEEARERYIQYLLRSMEYSSPIPGAELKQMGYAGPEIGELLFKQKLLWLDGHSVSKEDIEKLAAQIK
ncbi:hypothetical protein KAJ26_00475 [bacterium]|nr:hypothetical protein [bacterium]